MLPKDKIFMSMSILGKGKGCFHLHMRSHLSGRITAITWRFPHHVVLSSLSDLTELFDMQKYF